jgi:hypothetical protein
MNVVDGEVVGGFGVSGKPFEATSYGGVASVGREEEVPGVKGSCLLPFLVGWRSRKRGLLW